MAKLAITAFIFLASLLFSTCKKDESYSGNGLFWYNKSTAQKMVDDDVSSLTFFVDDQIVGSCAANVYFTSGPACGASGTVSFTKDMGNITVRSYPYRVEDNFGDIIWSGTVELKEENCYALELVY